MGQAELNAIFWQAVKAWEQRDLNAARAHRILLHNASLRGTNRRAAHRLHSLLSDYLCACPSEVIPFAAYAMGRACKALKGLDVEFTRVSQRDAIETVHKIGVNLLNHGERSAAIDSAIKLEGMRDAFEGLNNTLHQAAGEAQQDLLNRIQQAAKNDSVPFQGPRPTPTPLLALEGLFTTLSQRLDQLTQVRTDLPDDYLARSKASFTDALLTELERQHYHSPAFDRLITLRDAWDTGQ
ncbi:hypothetical protein, partial [Marinobacter mangrovi]|uniref:hypothetical protein n=1 Tax=Marinobacter mangrovi TaxID=2803918 RepID=UPI0019314D69